MDVRQIARTGRSALRLLRQPTYVTPGHFYSPISTPGDAERALSMTPNGAPGVDLREAAQLELTETLGPMWTEAPTDMRYTTEPVNHMYPFPDAAVYSSLLRHVKPRRVLEIGSGYSSAVALDTAERWGIAIEFTFVEPYPARLLGLLSEQDRQRTVLRQEVVQQTPMRLFSELSDGDVLFVDSTHVVKAGSDVWWLLLHVLPSLAPGVLVHVHDIHWPFQYPSSWLRERRDWTEAYLLHAFLAYNSAFEVVLFNDWLWRAHPEVVERYLPSMSGVSCGSIWFRRR